MARGIDRIDMQMAVLVTIWGSAFLGIKFLGDGLLDPFQLTWFRYAPFPLMYGTYLLLRRREKFREVEGKHWVLMGLLGFIGVVGYHFPLNWGLHGSGGQQVTGATGSILVATNPLWTLIIAVVRGKEQFRARAAIGFVVAFIGVAMVVLLGHGDAQLTIARKALVILLAPMSWAVYSVYSKPLVERYGGLFVTGVTLSLGTLTLVPLGFSYGTAPLSRLNGEAWFWLIFLALLSTTAGYAIWNNALKHRRASDVAVFIYCQPVVTALLGLYYLHEKLTGWFVAGSVLVLAGVILVNRARTMIAPPPAPSAATVGKA